MQSGMMFYSREKAITEEAVWLATDHSLQVSYAALRSWSIGTGHNYGSVLYLQSSVALTFTFSFVPQLCV